MRTPMAKKQQFFTCPKAHEERHPREGSFTTLLLMKEQQSSHNFPKATIFPQIAEIFLILKEDFVVRGASDGLAAIRRSVRVGRHPVDLSADPGRCARIGTRGRGISARPRLRLEIHLHRLSGHRTTAHDGPATAVDRVDERPGRPLDPEDVPVGEVRPQRPLNLRVIGAVVEGRGHVASAAGFAAVLGEVDLRWPLISRRPEERYEGDALAGIDPQSNLVLTVGLRQRGRAREATRHPTAAEPGISVGLEVEHAVPDHGMGRRPPSAWIPSRLPGVATPRGGSQAMLEVVVEDPAPTARLPGMLAWQRKGERRERADRQRDECDWSGQPARSSHPQSRNRITLLICRRTKRSAAVIGRRSKR
jgi:hypothetical protein